MTEQEWLECTDPGRMLEFLRGKVSDRKLRLFACACCRRINAHRPNTLHPAVITSEAFADGLASSEELRIAHSQIGGVGSFSSFAFAGVANGVAILENSMTAAEGAIQASVNFFALDAYEAVGYENPLSQHAANMARENECTNLVAQLREIFANPFRPVTIDPRWLTSTVVDLATTIYDERAFERMPILADALMDAGCDNETIIAHCRSEATHVRGCWVVDLLLGKE